MQAKLKILHSASPDELSAEGSMQMLGLALGQQGLGHDVRCALNSLSAGSPPGPGAFGPLRDAGIPVESFPLQRLWKYPAMRRFKKFAAGNRFDVIHCHGFRALDFACRATRGMSAPGLVCDVKNCFDIPESRARLYGSPRVGCIVVNAQLIKRKFSDTGLVDPEKIEVVYNGVDLDRFNPGIDGGAVRRELGLAPDAPVVGMIANFAGKKSHDILFQAAIKVLEKLPKARFLLAGGGDSQRYQKELTRHGYGGSFIFTGFRSDIPRIIAALDVCISSPGESQCLAGSLAEAMAMAKPVVAPAVAGNPEFVRDRDTGMLVEPGDAQAMADAMLFLLESPGEALAMGRRGFEFVKDKVDSRRRPEYFIDLYRRIMQLTGG